MLELFGQVFHIVVYFTITGLTVEFIMNYTQVFTRSLTHCAIIGSTVNTSLHLFTVIYK